MCFAKIRARGFTLVELLVVIAIIAMLVTLVTPGVRSALERGREAHFSSNLRQLAIAATSWAAGNGGHYPYYIPRTEAYPNGDVSKVWWRLLATDMNIPLTHQALLKIYRDPADTSLWNNQHETLNTAINGFGNNGEWPTPQLRRVNAAGRPLHWIPNMSELYLFGPGGASRFTTEWGSGTRVDGYHFLQHGPAVYHRYRNDTGSFYVMADGHVQFKTSEWVMQEAINRRTSSFFGNN